jgi:hypothetical protein
MTGSEFTIIVLASVSFASTFLMIQKWIECNRLSQQISNDMRERAISEEHSALWRTMNRLEDEIAACSCGNTTNKKKSSSF